MLKSLRSSYHPPIPSVLETPSSIVFELGSNLPVNHQIRQILVNSSDQPVVHAQLSSNRSFPHLKVGVLFSGGPAPGGHSAVSGIFDTVKKLHPQSQVLGFLKGAEGLIHNNYLELTDSILERYRNQGGFDLLGSSRTKVETEAQLTAVLKTALHHTLSGLIVIGGDDSNTNAAVIAEFLLQRKVPLSVIGIPKTIDGDLQHVHTPISFGFDTATKTYANLIGNLAKDVLSTRKQYHIIKLMGRSASHVTLECALRTHPNYTILTEEGKKFSELVHEMTQLIIKRAQMGKQFGIFLLPEGIAEILPKTVLREVETDSHGNLSISEVDVAGIFIQAIASELKNQGALNCFRPIPHFFGYEGRCAFPSNFDVSYSYSLGSTATLLIANGFTSYMAFVDDLTAPPSKWKLGGVPLASLMDMEMRGNRLQPVIKKKLVNLHSPLYQKWVAHRENWGLNEEYQMPGPIQFFGPDTLTFELPLTLSL